MQTLGIVLFALAIGVSIMLHEAGHMLTAKRYGMKVTQYFVGFGPTLWSFRRGETEYGLKAIPAGGFVKIIGMTPQEKLDPEDESRAMWRQPIGRRTVVLAAGSMTHFALTLVLIYLAAVFATLPNLDYNEQLDRKLDATVVGAVSACFTPQGESVEDPASCAAGDIAAPAAKGGLQPGDRVVSVDGKATGDWPAVTDAIRAVPAGETAAFVVDRDGATKTLEITPVAVPVTDAAGNVVEGETAVRVGVTVDLPTVPQNQSYGPVAAVPATLDFTWSLVEGTFTAIKNFPSKVPGLIDAITGQERDPEGPISVVGASRIGGDAAEIGGEPGLAMFLLILASLNLFIGVFNLFPLLPLDGGHIAVIWFEKWRSWRALRRGRPDPGRVDYNKLMPVTLVVVFVFATISLLAITADIVNPLRLN